MGREWGHLGVGEGDSWGAVGTPGGGVGTPGERRIWRTVGTPEVETPRERLGLWGVEGSGGEWGLLGREWGTPGG